MLANDQILFRSCSMQLPLTFFFLNQGWTNVQLLKFEDLTFEVKIEANELIKNNKRK